MKISAKAKFILFNIVAAIVVVMVITIIVLSRLDNYTRHGESIAVPEFHNLTPAEAEDIATHRNLRVEVIDSLYDESAKPGVVLEQYPSSGARVKENRLIHLTVNAQSPEKITFPNLKNSAFRQTLQTLESRGFKIGRIGYEDSEFKNLVLSLRQKSKEVEPGTLLPKGTTIDIILGNGYSDNTIIVPRLIGKKIKDAISMAHQNYMNMGQVIPDGSIRDKDDQLTAIVYKQNPTASEIVPAGSPITLYITLQTDKLNSIDTLIVTE